MPKPCINLILPSARIAQIVTQLLKPRMRMIGFFLLSPPLPLPSHQQAISLAPKPIFISTTETLVSLLGQAKATS